MNKVEGIIFDVDGTLLDSMPVWKNVGLRFLESVGISPKEDTEERLRSMSLYDAAVYYKEECNVPMTVEEIIDRINGMIEHFYLNEEALKPGVRELLESLYNAGVKMCIATATDRYLIEGALKNNGIDKYFGKIFTCGEVGAGKESPLIFDQAMKYLGTSKDNTVIFEDALYSIRTAKTAGYTVIAVEDKQAGNPEDIVNLADFYMKEGTILNSLSVIL